MTAPKQALVERVAVAMWDTWNRVMVEYGLFKQSNGDFHAPEPTDDSIKAEAHRLLRKAAIAEAQAALDACRAEEMVAALNQIAAWNEGQVVDDGFDEPCAARVARRCLAKIGGEP